VVGRAKILPCPFCGGEARSVSTTYGNGDMVECQLCAASGPPVMYGGDESGEYTSRYYNQAVSSWNARVNKVKRCEEALKAIIATGDKVSMIKTARNALKGGDVYTKEEIDAADKEAEKFKAIKWD